MVGWAGRNRRSERQIKEAQIRYDEWYNSLSPEQKMAEKVKQKKNGQKTLIFSIIACILAFIVMPISAVLIVNHNREETWKAAKVVSQNAKTICKEIEYCVPCAPVVHWHKKVFCRSK